MHSNNDLVVASASMHYIPLQEYTFDYPDSCVAKPGMYYVKDCHR